MLVQVNAGNGVRVQDSVAANIEAQLAGSLSRFADQITRVEVHLSDENRAKGGGNDKRCMIEARLEGLAPIAVTNLADDLPLAIDGAADKLEKAIGHELGRLRHGRQGRVTLGEIEPVDVEERPR